MSLTASERTTLSEVLLDVEAKRESLTDYDAEAQVSINEWITRVREASMTAHKAARNGVHQELYEASLEVAAIGVGLAEWANRRWSEAEGA
jgi:hypothetical protein